MESLRLFYTEDITLDGSDYRIELFFLIKDKTPGPIWAKVYELEKGFWEIKDSFKVTDYLTEPGPKPEMNSFEPTPGPKTLTPAEVADKAWKLFKLK